MNNTEWSEFYKSHESGQDKRTYRKMQLKPAEEVKQLSPAEWIKYMDEFVKNYAWDIGRGDFRYVGNKCENCMTCRNENTY